MRTCAITLLAALALLACKAEIPDGVYACTSSKDCPSGFSCGARGSDPERYCFAGDAAGDAGNGPDGGGDGGGGAGRSGDGGSSAGKGGAGASGSGAGTGGDAGTSGEDGGAGNAMPEPVAPAPSGFSSVGQRRGADGFVLYDDGFERGERLCTTDRALCVTGGFSP